MYVCIYREAICFHSFEKFMAVHRYQIRVERNAFEIGSMRMDTINFNEWIFGIACILYQLKFWNSISKIYHIDRLEITNSLQIEMNNLIAARF